VFVKPNNGGSSIGMSKVTEADKLDEAIEKAFKEDDQVLIEEFIAGREFTIGVFKRKGEIITLPITEVISKKDFFDYEAKYLGMSDEITPAQVDESVANKVRTAARKVYELLNCRGIVRIDFIYNEQAGEPYMLEVNTVPGQSEASIIPQQVKAMGSTLKDFYTAVIEECWQ
jgi:D-alanine-D-alanine ligase